MKQPRAHRSGRHDQIKSHLIEEHRHDPYKAHGKLAEPSICPDCGAVFAGGRWQWQESAPAAAKHTQCPACRRTHDKAPAGEIILTGGFLAAHSAEIVSLARNVEAAEKREHPLQRIMGIEESAGRIRITTTDIHLPRRIAHALEHAFKGALETHYDEAGHFVRVVWSRD